MPFYILEKSENLHRGYCQSFEIAGRALLLVQAGDTPYLIENRCGHFGVPLDTGELVDNTIVCSQHGISFNLETGAVSNRPYENADPVPVFKIEFRDGNLGVQLDE